MPRPRCCRRVHATPAAELFEPAGLVGGNEELAMTLDELEALRLADLDGLYHNDAAEQMGVSRATFGRIVASARRKVATALINGHALRIAGGPVTRVAADGRGRGSGRGRGRSRGCGCGQQDCRCGARRRRQQQGQQQRGGKR